jgi:hypothetical protein
VASVVPEIGKAERERARRKHPASLNAWDCYQRGLWHLYNRTGRDFLEAERLFKQGEQKDQIAIAVRPDAPNLAAWIDVVLDNVGLQLKPSGLFTLGTDWAF